METNDKQQAESQTEKQKLENYKKSIAQKQKRKNNLLAKLKQKIRKLKQDDPTIYPLY